MAKLFISFQHDDHAYREGFEGVIRNPNHRFSDVPVSARDDLCSWGEVQLRNYLRALIRSADALVCLIGDNTHRSRWVEYELSVAASLQVPIVVIDIPRHEGKLPSQIASRRRYPWRQAEAAVRAVL